MTTKRILSAFLFGLFFFNSFGQNILDDVNTLLHSIETLERVDSLDAVDAQLEKQIQEWSVSASADTLAMIDSLRNIATTNLHLSDSLTDVGTANMMAVLYAYDQSNLSDSIVAGTWDELQVHYADNPMITNLLKGNQFKLPDTVGVTATQVARQKAEVVDSAPRLQILQRMDSPLSASPADYLSVSSTLEKYRTPAFPPVRAMAISAENSNKNVSGGGLVSQAAFIEGLFLFILDRAEDEVIINFLDRLLDQETPQLKKLFPTVVAEFGDINFTYSSSFIQRLREAFYEDVQKLSIRLPLLMLTDEYFEPLQSEPIAYNLLALYSMIGLSSSGMEVEEMVPVTHRFLFQNFEEKTKELNFILADSAYQTPTYQELISQSQSAYDRIRSIFQNLNNAEYTITDSIVGTRAKLFNLGVPISEQIDAPDVNDFLKPSYDLNALVNPKDSFGLEFLPDLLRGYLDAEKLEAYNTVASYDRFFGQSYSPTAWRATGLELAEKLSGTWYDEFSLPDHLRNWREDLVRYQLAARTWTETVDTVGAYVKATIVTETERKNLYAAIKESKTFWATNSKPLPNDTLAFSVLANLISPKTFQLIDEEIDLRSMIYPEFAPKANTTRLEQKRELLVQVEERFKDLDDRLYAGDTTMFRVSPYRKYVLAQQPLEPFIGINSQINDLETNLGEIEKLIDQLSQESYARLAARSRENAKPVIQLTGLTSNLMFCLLTNESDSSKWLTKTQLNGLLDGGKRENAFLGLVQQRMSKTENIGLLSPNGLADLTRLTIKDLQLLREDTSVVNDSLAFYRKAAFAIHTLNRILELPLLVNPANPLQYQPLADRSTKLKSIPEISSQALDFIYFLNTKEHGQAISSLIRLFTSLNFSVDGNMSQEELRKVIRDRRKKKKKLQKSIASLDLSKSKDRIEYTSLNAQLTSLENEDAGREYALAYLQKYGDFISGLLDARSQYEVEEILKHASDPPGSSRIKRTSPFTVGINSFLGATVGAEQWELDSESTDFVSFAPTMPVGIAVSWLTKKQQSWSIYASILDVGTLLTFRPDDDNFGDTDFTFKNVFKPGVQLQYNIKNSPFYLGVGWQRGPQYQNINGEQTSITSNRYFLGFGVDVPIKTLYQR